MQAFSFWAPIQVSARVFFKKAHYFEGSSVTSWLITEPAEKKAPVCISNLTSEIELPLHLSVKNAIPMTSV